MPGHVEKRGKYYMIVIDLGRDANGERLRKFHRTDMTRKTDAERLMVQILSEVETGLYVEPNKITVTVFLRKWIEEYAKKKLAIRTYTCYEEIFELHVIPYIGHLLLNKLKPLHLEKYYNEMLEGGRLDKKEGGLSPNSVLKHHRILHKAFSTAVRWELLSHNPADNAEAPKKVDPEMSYYEPDQAVAMLEAAEGTGHYGEVVMAAYSGARRGEVCGLRWQDVDWKDNLLKIRQTIQYTAEEGIYFKKPKSKKGKRDIEVPALVMDVLREHKVDQNKKKLAFEGEFQDNDLVFCQDDGQPMHPDTISSWFPEFLERNKLPRIRFHDLRHTYVSILINSKIPDNEIAARAGHADPSTPKRLYGHVFKRIKTEATSAVENALKRKKL